MDEETRDEQEEQGKQGAADVLFSWKRKFDNFWYHYKIPFVLGVIILIFIIFCIAQCSLRTKGDANIGYIGAQEIDAEHYENLQRALNEMLGEDLNGDGKVHVEFTHFLYMTKIQMENARAMNKPVDMQSLMTVGTQIDLELTAGNLVIYFIDYEVYKELSETRSGVFMPLEDALGYIPEDAYDSYALRLGNLQCWAYYEGLENFPASTAVVMRDMLISEEDKEEIRERYKRNRIMFKKLVDFKYLKEDIEE